MNDGHFLPVQRHAVVERDRIVAEALDGRPALILLQGGGGTGKTLTAAQIGRAFLQADAGADAVWVRLTEEDAGREGVWQRILLTLAEAGVLPVGSAGASLAEGGLAASGPRELVTAFSGVPSRLMLILDDAHLALDPHTEESLLDVLEHTPDLTLVVTTRRTLPRLSSVHARTRLPVRALDAAALALSESDVRSLLAARIPGTTEAARVALAASIHRESRGWPLAAHALVVEREMLAEPAGAASGSHQAPGAFVRELVDRILHAADIRMTETLCLLGLLDEISADVLAIALSISADDARHVLERVTDTSSGSWTEEEGTRWYRVHDLIRDELRRRRPVALDASRVQELASRAVAPLRTARPRQALEAAVIGREWEQLSEILIEGSTITLTRRLSHTRLADIPEDVRERYPVIAAFALIDEYAYPGGRFGRVMTGLRMLAGRALAAESAKSGLPGLTAAVLRTVAARLSGNERVAVQMAERVREVLHQLDDDEIERYRRPLQTGINQTAITLLHAGRLDEAEQLLEPMIDWQDRLLPRTRAHAVSLAAWATAWSGRSATARALLERGRQLELPVGWHDSYIGAGYRIAGALDALERDDAAAAEAELAALAEHAATIEHWPFLACIEALIVERQQGPATAAERLARQISRRQGRSAALPSASRMMADLRARLLWHSGRVLPAPRRRGTPDLAAVYAAMSRGDAALASALAAAVEHEAGGDRRRLAESLLVQAECGRRSGDAAAAAHFASRAGALMRSEGLSLPMRALPRAAALELAALAPELPVERSSPTAVRSARPLTGAERRALLAVAEHSSVRLAAEALFLSPETVKGYLKQVYRKLGVNSRAEAIRVAGETGLLRDDPDARLSLSREAGGRDDAD